MEKLAVGQGGNGTASASSAHAQNVENESRVTNFLAKGEEILNTFKESIRAFEGQTLQIKTLASTVSELKEQIGGKRSFSSTDEPSSSAKKIRPEIEIDSDDGAGQDETDEIQELLNPEDNEDNNEQEFIESLSGFFEEEAVTGEAINDKVATLINKSLRGKSDEEKMKGIKEKYKRPSNVEHLQVPKVDRVLWEQLKWQTKATDSLRQKAIHGTMEGLMPIIMAMDHIASHKQPDLGLIKGYIGDTFKILCNQVNKNNSERQESIKKELSHKYKSVCENSASATALFGDSLVEDIKKLDSRPVKLTTKPAFLGRGGAMGPSYRRPQIQSNPRQAPYQIQRNQNFQRSQTQYQRSPYQRPHGNAPSFRGGKRSEKSGITKKI